MRPLDHPARVGKAEVIKAEMDPRKLAWIAEGGELARRHYSWRQIEHARILTRENQP